MFLKGGTKVKGVVGLSIVPGKISLAHVISDEAQSPRLELLESVRYEGEAEQAKALTGLVKKHGLTNASCNLVIEPNLYHLLQVEAPPVEDDEIKSALKWQIKDLIDFPVDEAITDLFKVPELNNPGPNRPKLIYVAAMHAPKHHALVELVKSSGLKLSSIDITELVLRNIASCISEDEDGVALLHLAEGWSLVNLTRCLTVYLTRGLSVNMRQLQSIEESLAGEFGICFEENARLDDLVLEIQRSMGYYESYYGQAPIGSLVITPTTPELPSFIHHLNLHLGIPVRTLDLNMLLATTTPLDLTQQADGLLAVGAALRMQEALK